jgi:hypothetical protein
MLNFAGNKIINELFNFNISFSKKGIAAPQKLLQVARFLKKIFFPVFQKF